MSTNRTSIYSRMKALHALAILAILTLALALAGCGATTLTTGAGEAPTATVSVAPTATTTQAPIPTGSEGPCDSTSQQATDVGSPTYVLTPTTPGRSETVHVGDTVQVRLPKTSRWSFQTQSNAGALTVISPSGVYAPTLNACVWTFQAKTTGADTLNYVGSAICKQGQPCPAYRLAMDFTINVSQ